MKISIQVPNENAEMAEVEIEFFDLEILSIRESDFWTTFKVEVNDETEEAFINDLEKSFKK